MKRFLSIFACLSLLGVITAAADGEEMVATISGGSDIVAIVFAAASFAALVMLVCINKHFRRKSRG